MFVFYGFVARLDFQDMKQLHIDNTFIDISDEDVLSLLSNKVQDIPEVCGYHMCISNSDSLHRTN